MAYDSHAGLGTQLENSKHLISMATTYPLYSPIFALIKLDAYGSFVISVETAKYTPFVKIGFTIIKALLTNSSAKPINMLFLNILIGNLSNVPRTYFRGVFKNIKLIKSSHPIIPIGNSLIKTRVNLR